MTSSWKHRMKLASIPSTVFAAIVFTFGWMSVSPFASWPLGIIALLCIPAMIPFVLFVADSARRQKDGRLFGRGLSASRRTVPPFRWREVLTTGQAVYIGILGVLVFVSFFAAMGQYRGSPEMVDGSLVFTDHGKVIGPATARQADEARTTETRMVSGHLMLFGVVGLFANVRTATIPSSKARPATR